jgi:aspartate-semialdehyde dehydrogenase
MATKKKFKLALIGTDSLRGREIKNTLGQKKIGAFDLEFYDPEVQEEFSKLTEFKKAPKVIHGPGRDFLKGTDLVFLASDPETNRTIGLRALEQGFRAIDLGEVFNERQDVPLLVAGVNDDDLDPAQCRLIANPHPVTIILSHLFHLARGAFGMARAAVFVLQPASAFDNPGIQELAAQSVALLNGAVPKKKVVKEQMAFNILSHTETPAADGSCPSEQRIVAEIRRVLGRPSFPLSLSIIQAPVFHTYSLMVHLELARDADITAFETTFRKDAAFKLTEFRKSCSASSITVSGKDEIFVGRIKKEESGPRTFWVWLVADNVTCGSAVNAVEIAKKILKARSA